MTSLATTVHNRLGALLLAIIGLQLILLIISLPGQRILGDEAAFAEFAYFQAKDGYVHSELFRGLLRYEERVLLYHKLFEWLGAVMIGIFGFGIWPLRALSLLATLVLILLLYRHTRTCDTEQGRIVFLGATAFLLLAPLTFMFAKYYRPEMMQAAMGLGSFMALHAALQKERMRWAALAGALAGLALLTHLNGAVFVFAGGVLLLSRKRWRAAVVFGVLALAVFSAFFIEVIGRFDLFYHQYAADPTFGESERTLGGTLMKIVNEHKRLFRKPEIIFSSVLFFTAVAANVLRDGWRRRRDFYVYTAACLLCLAAIAPAKTTAYAILLFPFFAIEIGWLAAAWHRDPSTWSRPIRLGIAVVAAAFVIHAVAADTINATTDKQDWAGDNRRLAAHIEPGSRVLAPLDFVFNELPNYNIAGRRLAYWTIYDWGGKPYTFADVTAYADSAGITAIILKRIDRDRMGLSEAAPGEVHDGFQVAANLTECGRMLLISDGSRHD